jgi:CubicO group peptidase (beta-lactamase class C family)
MNMTKESDWLAPALAYVEQWLGYQMRHTEQVGCAVAVAYRGAIVLDTAFGHADLGKSEALTPRHRFRVASHSKSFTAAAILKLPPAIDANTRLKYSNHGFALAGLVIEAITGEPYTAWVMREIVRPSGLKETTPDVPLPAKAKLARGHSGKVLLGRRQIFPGDQSTHALAAATGFVSTAGDLVRFFGQLAPSAKDSVLSVASRREMIRAQWRDAFSPIETGYGLGIITGAMAGWDWFGHSGGFQGYLSRTVVVPRQDLAISVLSNAADGVPALWSDGVLSILSRFKAEGAPTPKTKDWAGRWWSVWGATDFVPMGDKVLMAVPAMPAPFLKVPELTVTGRDKARIAQAGAFGNYGEPVRRVRGRNGKVAEIRAASGSLVPEAALAKELTLRYRR